jgi:hypothetical protein
MTDGGYPLSAITYHLSAIAYRLSAPLFLPLAAIFARKFAAFDGLNPPRFPAIVYHR